MKAKIAILLLLSISLGALAQQPTNLNDVQPGRFDQGKMWTFENPPVEYFKEAYGFDATEEWLDDARKSALRFSTGCSASFISENGLILTNHHCSRGVVASVMRESENFDNNGFYAKTAADERSVANFFDIGVAANDITDEDWFMEMERVDSYCDGSAFCSSTCGDTSGQIHLRHNPTTKNITGRVGV